MTALLNGLPHWLPTWALVLARVAGIGLAVPMFLTTDVPAMVRVVLVVGAAAAVFPMVATHVPADVTWGQAVGGLAGELILGELIGLTVGGVFLAAQLAGQIASQQSGLSLGTVFNPLYDAETTVFEQLWQYVVMGFFFAARGHLAVADALLGSFSRLPPPALLAVNDAEEFLPRLLDTVFDVALRLAGPTVLALLLATAALGLLSKTMPQFNILSIGFTLKTALAIAVVGLSISVCDDVVRLALDEGLDSVRALIGAAADRSNG